MAAVVHSADLRAAWGELHELAWRPVCIRWWAAPVFLAAVLGVQAAGAVFSAGPFALAALFLLAGNLVVYRIFSASGLASTAATYGTAVGSQQTAMLAAQMVGMWANGGAFSNGVKAFAKGGTFTNEIVNSPTLFRFANGTGLMGEAGPEAIMPLARDSSGRLGVRYEGREAPQSRGNSNVSNNNINVTVNSKTGDPAEIRRSGAAVARQVANAVAGSGRYR